MRYFNLLTLTIIIIFISCKDPKKDHTNVSDITTETKEFNNPTLTLKWSTDTLLTTSESVIYDRIRKTIYVSNIAGKADSVDGVGFISKVDLNGKITELNWISGLNAPKGLGIYNDKLYVTDIDKIVEIDIEKGEISNNYDIEGAIFLNDITVGSDGKVYASGSRNGVVYVLENGETSILLDSLAGPNGLLYDKGEFFVALWDDKTLNMVNLENKKIHVITECIENPDGIVAVGDGTYLVSSWQGLIHMVKDDQSKVLLLDTSSDEIGAADIDYIPEMNLLLVPTFYKNGLMAYELKN